MYTFSIIINEKGGQPRIMEFDKGEVTIGRVAGNDIVLPKGNISKRHSRIVQKDGKFIIVDLKSTNGTYVNGKKITTPQVIKQQDKIYIGDFTLTIEASDQAGVEDAGKGAKPPPAPPDGDDPFKDFGPEGGAPDAGPSLGGEEPPPMDGGLGEMPAETEQPPPPPPPPPRHAKGKSERFAAPKPPRPSSGGQAAYRPVILGGGQSVAAKRSREQADALDLSSLAAAQLYDAVSLWLEANVPDATLLPEDELSARIKDGLDECLQNLDAELPPDVTKETLAEVVKLEVVGLGALEEPMRDESVTEIFVNGPLHVAVTRAETATLLDTYFSSSLALEKVIRRLAERSGVREDNPLLEVRLKDGSRLQAVFPPVAKDGPVLRWQRGSRVSATVQDLVAQNVLSQPMVEFLQTCVGARRNVLVAGPSASGKTRLLAALASLVPDTERVVVLEEATELTLPQPQVVSMETRPTRADGSGGVDMPSLVRQALRLRPDRLVVSECQGAEVLPLLLAMSAGQDGTVMTVNAHGTRDCLARLEMMVSLGGQDLPAKAVRELIANGVDVIVLMTRFADGSVRVSQVCEVSGMEVDIITVQDIFSFRREGHEDNGAPRGKFLATGFVPRFYEDLQQRGMSPNMAIFREDG